MRILAVKNELCNGCGECEKVCAMTFFKTPDRQKSAIRVEKTAGGGYVVNFCDQCGECIAVCPTEALYRIKNGIVRLRAAGCVGCLACVGFCPTLVMYAVPDDIVPIKCIACAKCVPACPTGALFMIDVETPPAVTEVTRSIRAKTGATPHGR
jgi:Fe-S-cluster-containing hydrogenase component 2